MENDASGDAIRSEGYFSLLPKNRAALTRQEILVSAVAVIAERGLESTRLSDISSVCGVPVGELEHQFGGLDSLVRAAFQHLGFSELGATVGAMRADEDPWTQLRALIGVATAENEGFEMVWRGWIEFWRAAIRNPRLRDQADEGYQQLRGVIEQIVRVGVDQGRFSVDLHPAVVAFQIEALIDGFGIPLVIHDSGLQALPLGVTDMLVAGIARLVGLQEQ